MKIVYTLIISLLMVSCASTPVPVGLFDDARNQILLAEQADAETYAPLELRAAREKYQAIQVAVDKNDNEMAGYLANESIVDSQLAMAKTAAAKARQASQLQREKNEKLKSDLQQSLGADASEGSYR